MPLTHSLVKSLTEPLAKSLTSELGYSMGVSFPSTNRLALWLTKNIVSSTKGSYIPNSWASTVDDGNLLKNAGHIAGSTNPSFTSWTTSNATLTADQTGPDAKTSAVRVLATAASGLYFSSGVSWPAGTYTLVVPIKSNTGSSQTVLIGGGTGGLASKTATTSWTEIATSWTEAAPAGGLVLAKDNGAGTLDVLVGTPRLYSGDVTGAIPAAKPLAGHLKFGVLNPPTESGSNYVTYASGSSTHGMAQWDDYIDFSIGNATYFSIVRFASEPPAGVGALFGLRENSLRMIWGFRGTGMLCQGLSLGQTQQKNGLLLAGDGWHVLGVVTDATANERRFYIDKQLVGIVSGVDTSTTDRDFVVGSGVSCDSIGGGLYNRALSTTEWATLVDACNVEIVAHGQSKGTIRDVIIAEGDSITTDGVDAANHYPDYAAQTPLSPRRYIITLAYPGNGYTEVNNRRATRKRFIDSDPTRNHFVSFWWTNGLELSGTTYLTNITSVVADAKTDGFTKVLVCTPTPKTQANYNTERAVVVAGTPGSIGGDVYCYFHSDSRYGDDADASDISLYPDGSHPTTTVQSYMAERWSVAVNSL